MPDQPRVGDAFGDLLRAALIEERAVAGTIRPVLEIVERDDGYLTAAPAARYFAGPESWPDYERRALAKAVGRTLDVGVGAGRVALALQQRGVSVVGLDVSAGAMEVAAARGVRQRVCATIEQHAAAAGPAYDCFMLFGNNLGLLAGRAYAPRFLATLAALARPGARLIAQGADPYATEDELHLRYHQRNRDAGRLGGQLRIRVRHRDVATDWFDYLRCSPAELADLVTGTPWRIDQIDDTSPPNYVAVLSLV